MTLSVNSPVTALLQQQGIAYDVIEIPLSEDKKPIRHLEELLGAKNLDPASVVRSVLFRGGSEQFYLLAVAGGGRADWGVLRKQLNERKLRMADVDEVPTVTGYVVGAVPPIALPENLKVLLDSSIHHYETVVIGSGVLGYALTIKKEALLELLVDAEQGDFAQT